MSDDESAYSASEGEEGGNEEEHQQARDEAKEKLKEDADEEERRKKGDEGANFLKSRQQIKMSELDEQLAEYIAEWRKQRSKEEDELKKLKEKQAKRKILRAEEEKKLTEQKRAEEDRKMREEGERKQREQEEKRKRLEEAEKKRQSMMKGSSEDGGKKFVSKGGDKLSNIQAAKGELGKTREQLAEEKKIALSIRVKPLNVDGIGASSLRSKAEEMWNLIIKLETEKYDMEERMKRQDYDLKELKERQKQQLRQKALKKGLDAEALTGKHPPKIQTASKFERRTDRRTYDDKKQLFEGPSFPSGSVSDLARKLESLKPQLTAKRRKSYWNPLHLPSLKRKKRRKKRRRRRRKRRKKRRRSEETVSSPSSVLHPSNFSHSHTLCRLTSLSEHFNKFSLLYGVYYQLILSYHYYYYHYYYYYYILLYLLQ
nr:troponin T-like isoform X3 [Procambarus clarkii]